MHMIHAAGARPRRRWRPRRRYSALYKILRGRSHRRVAVYFNRFLAFVIVANVVLFVVQSVPGVRETNTAFFDGIEAFSSIFFAIEYAARLYTIPEHPFYAKRGPVWGRLSYALCNPHALIDAAACLPFFVEAASGRDVFRDWTWVKCLRLFRVLKAERYAHVFSSVYRVVWFNREILSVTLFIGLMLLLITSTLLFYLAPPVSASGSAGALNSIPAAFYVTVLLLTGQGYDFGVLPWYTKIIIAATAVFSVAVFTIPASILVWGFEGEAERLMLKARERRLRAQRRKEQRKSSRAKPLVTEAGHVSTDSSSTSAGDDDDWSEGAGGGTAEEGAERNADEWAEYERVVLGVDEPGEGGGGVQGGDEVAGAVAASAAGGGGPSSTELLQSVLEKLNRLTEEVSRLSAVVEKQQERLHAVE